ncbi:hypothetical protein ACIPRL_07970 [Streptomyces sp. NPDC090085]|uniref:hypothetical protein n=1 Tax=Streptomyces sp. NPDC090085 TaxID=3365943 RepID=UPI0037F489C4
MHKSSAGDSHSAAGAPVHALRMWWRTQGVRSCPRGADLTRLTRNLRAFIPTLLDFADADGGNRRPPGRALIAMNVGCGLETVPLLYTAAEALGLLTVFRTPKGQVCGYRFTAPLPGLMPDWTAACAVLASDRRALHKAKSSSHDAHLPAPESSSYDCDLQGSPEAGSSSYDAHDRRHMTNGSSSCDDTTRLTTSLNHDMDGVFSTSADPRARGVQKALPLAVAPGPEDPVEAGPVALVDLVEAPVRPGLPAGPAVAEALPGVDAYAAGLQEAKGRTVQAAARSWTALVPELPADGPQEATEPPLTDCRGADGAGCDFGRPAILDGLCMGHLVKVSTGRDVAGLRNPGSRIMAVPLRAVGG